jgi:hypothetical protein
MNTKQVYNQQTARIKDRKHSYEFRLFSLAVFMQCQLIFPEAQINRIAIHSMFTTYRNPTRYDVRRDLVPSPPPTPNV